MSIQSLLAEARGWRRPRIDAAWAAIAVIFAVLAAVVPPQATASTAFTAKAVWSVLPFFVLSIGLAAYAKATGAENLIAKAFSGRSAPMVVLATLVGALSPFCSCGVIPIIVALLAAGVPLAPVMAFWLASPLMDPSMFAITTGVLGLPFAVAKTVAAVAVGLLGGFGVLALQRAGIVAGAPLQDAVGNGGCAGSKIRASKAVVWRYWREPQRRETFRAGARQNALFLGKWLILAFVLESLMVAYVPDKLIAGIAGEGLVSIVLATLVGIPSYLNGNAALPLVAGLMDKGMTPGAAMAFLVAGGVTSMPAALAVWAVARRQVFAAYLAFAILGALLSGVAFQLAAG